VTGLLDASDVAVPGAVPGPKPDRLARIAVGLLHAHLPDAQLVLFPDGGHSSFLDEPEAYLDTVIRFLRGR
jgi:pimeloyl-ACP methyl ester carboxylesterase